MQRRETFIGCVFDVCAELAQGIYQNADGALLHTLRAGDDTSAGGYTKIGGEEAHGCPGCHNVYMLRIALQCTYHDAGVVTIAQVVERLFAMGKSVQDKCAVTDTFGCRELDTGMQRGIGSGNGVTHSCIR